MTGALDFTNFQLNIFGCELEPTVAESDTYTFCSAGDSTLHLQQNQVHKSVDDGVGKEPEAKAAPPETESPGLAEPDKGHRDRS